MKSLIALLLLTTAAHAQTVCMGYPAMAAMLADRFNMAKQIVVIETPEVMGELWLTPDGNGWTWLERRADGSSCMALAGPAWMGALPVKAKPGDPA